MAPKIGKDGRQLFDENRGYNGPDWITSIMWISADVNVKDALLDLQMELKGEHLQIWWKPVQKKNTKKQILIYGLPPGFNPRGIMRELMYGLKESEKELCNAKRASLEKISTNAIWLSPCSMVTTSSPPPQRLRLILKALKIP